MKKSILILALVAFSSSLFSQDFYLERARVQNEAGIALLGVAALVSGCTYIISEGDFRNKNAQIAYGTSVFMIGTSVYFDRLSQRNVIRACKEL